MSRMPAYLSQLADEDKCIFESAYTTQNALVSHLHTLARECGQQAIDVKARLNEIDLLAKAVDAIDKQLACSTEAVKKDLASHQMSVFECPKGTLINALI